MTDAIEPGDLVFWFMAMWTVHSVNGQVAVLHRIDVEVRAPLSEIKLWRKGPGR